MPADRLLHPRCGHSAWTPVEVPAPTTMRGRRKWALPTVPGVYAFSLRGTVIYIGSTANLRKRVAAHVNSFRWRDGITVKVAVTLIGWEMRERRLVRRLRPAHNREWNIGKRAMGGRFTDHQPFGSLS